jgi:hypothetical protein
MDHQLDGVTVQAFLADLHEAVAHLDLVQPAALREPISLWLRAAEARAIGQGWKHLLGRDVVAAWNAAQAILAAHRLTL